MAALTLDADPSARVECPDCGMEMLRFEEGPGPSGDPQRHLRCGFCGASDAPDRGST